MSAGKKNLWMMISFVALGMSLLVGFKVKNSQEAAPEKEICREQPRAAALKKASLQLWENIVRL